MLHSVAVYCSFMKIESWCCQKQCGACVGLLQIGFLNVRQCGGAGRCVELASNSGAWTCVCVHGVRVCVNFLVAST